MAEKKKSQQKTLTPKETIFVLEYLIDLNPNRAAIKAGFSKTMAESKAYQWVSNGKVKPHVYAAIQEALKKRGERIERTGDDVVRLLWKMAELDLADYITVAEGGEVQAITFDQLPKGATKLISKIKEKRTIMESKDGLKMSVFSNLEYELPEKTKCLEMLGRHYGLFNDTLKLDVKDLGTMLAAARSRVDGTTHRKN